MQEMMQRMNRRRSIMEGVEPAAPVVTKTKSQLFNATDEGGSDDDSDSDGKPKITNLSSLSTPRIQAGGSSDGSSDEDWESD